MALSVDLTVASGPLRYGARQPQMLAGADATRYSEKCDHCGCMDYLPDSPPVLVST